MTQEPYISTSTNSCPMLTPRQTANIRSTIERINDSSFGMNDISSLLLAIRSITPKKNKLLDIINFIAHQEGRDQGASKDFFEAVYFPLAHNRGLFGTKNYPIDNPTKKEFDALINVIQRTEDRITQLHLGKTPETALKEVRLLYDQLKGHKYRLKPSPGNANRGAVYRILGAVTRAADGMRQEFQPEELIENLCKVLESIDVPDIKDIYTRQNMLDSQTEIVACIIGHIGGLEFIFYDGEKGRLYANYDENKGRLQLCGEIIPMNFHMTLLEVGFPFAQLNNLPEEEYGRYHLGVIDVVRDEHGNMIVTPLLL